MKRNSFSETRGFTLIELAVVLFIMSVVIALTAPGIVKSFSNLSLKTTAKKVGGALRYSRSQAVNTGSIYNTIFDTENNRVIVMQIPSPPAPNLTGRDNEAEEDPEETDFPAIKQQKKELKTYPFPDGIVFKQILIADIDSREEEEDGIYQISFSPGGSSTGGKIILADEKERMYQITVNSMTGVVTVKENEEDDD